SDLRSPRRGRSSGRVFFNRRPRWPGTLTPDGSPKSTTNTTTIFGVTFALTFFGPGMDASSITDFNGFVGVADVQGSGTATNPDGSTETLLFDTDMRFMTGTYVGKDGHIYRGALGFV